MLLRTAIGKCLADLGIHVTFGVLGGGNMYMIHELVAQGDVTYVPVAREDGAVLMAAGYARASGELGFATVTYGGSMSNTVTALVEASRSSSPVLVLTGDYPVTKPFNERERMQHIDLNGVCAAAGVEYRRIHATTTATKELTVAATDALLESRPIVVGVPIDMQTTEVEYTTTTRIKRPQRRLIPDPEELDAAAGIIASARHPLILAGRGVNDSGARDTVIGLADRIGAPLATTLLAKGLFQEHPWNIGIFGSLSTDPASQTIAEADCVITIGASLSDMTTLNGELLAGKTIVQCDTRESTLRRWPTQARVHADAREFSHAVIQLLDAANVAPTNFRSETLRHNIDNYNPYAEFTDHSGPDGLDMRTVMLRLSQLLPANRTVITDGGRFAYSALRNMAVPDGTSLIPAISFGAIGQGLGTAIGVAHARPDRPTVLVTGDGGLLMSFMEFRSAVEFNLDLITIVMNDGMYGQEYQRFRLEGMTTDLARIQTPDFAALATSAGGTATRVESLSDLTTTEKLINERRGPLLIDVKTQSKLPIGFYD